MPNVRRHNGSQGVGANAELEPRAPERRPSSITLRNPGAPPATTSADFSASAVGNQSVHRSCQSAVDFVTRFNAQQGLGKSDRQAKTEHMGTDAGRFMTAMPALFYSDVRGSWATDAQLRATPSPQGLLVGDAHLGNLTTRSGPEGKTVWGWGDCDKSGVGRLEWDLDRLATHTVIAARGSDKNFSSSEQRELVAAASDGYTRTLREFLSTGERPEGFLRKKELEGALHDFVHQAAHQDQAEYIKGLAPHGEFPKSQQASAADEVAIRAAVTDYATRLPPGAPVRLPLEVLAVGIDSHSVGGSNSGMDKYLALLAPATDGDPPVVLKLKQVLPSAVSVGTGDLSRSDARQTMSNAAVLEGYRNPLQGFATVNGRSCTVEPMMANTAIVDPTGLNKTDFLDLATQAGVALARSQLQNPNLTADQVRAWLGDSSTDGAATARLQQFALAYADQTEADAKALKKS